MAVVSPFRALRPRPADAAAVASVPYDVVSTEEARALAEGHPLSFLRVSRAEIELPATTDPYADAVYERAVDNFARFRRSSLVVEEEASLYLYRLRMGDHEQTGVAACFSIDEYERDVIRKHERTRRDKEDDRTRHILALRAQTGPVFLTYRALPELDRLTAVGVLREPLADFEADDRVRHTIWRIDGRDCAELVQAFEAVPTLYIADGHHRAASAARARAELARRGAGRPRADGDAEFNTVLAVAFPDDQVQILPYNRTVSDLAGLSLDRFIEAVHERFATEPGPPTPVRRGEIAMYVGRRWRTLRPRTAPPAADAVASLDVSVLQNDLLGPILRVVDVRVDKRIDFVGGARGTGALEHLVDTGRAAVGFSMFPVTVGDLIGVADAGAIMPPKSTWFEPKLRDGLLIHLI